MATIAALPTVLHSHFIPSLISATSLVICCSISSVRIHRSGTCPLMRFSMFVILPSNIMMLSWSFSGIVLGPFRWWIIYKPLYQSDKPTTSINPCCSFVLIYVASARKSFQYIANPPGPVADPDVSLPPPPVSILC